MVNSVWPEIIKGIEERLSYLFNPGNPDIFYEVRPQRRSHCDHVQKDVPVHFCVCDSVSTPSLFVALQRQSGVCAEVWASVQFTGQCEEAEAASLIHQLPQQVEPARLLPATVNNISVLCVTLCHLQWCAASRHLFKVLQLCQLFLITNPNRWNH